MIPRRVRAGAGLTTLGNRPLAVLTASENLGTEGWPAAQDRHGGLSTDSVHTRRRRRPTPAWSRTRTAAAESVRAITAVVRAVSAGSALATP